MKHIHLPTNIVQISQLSWNFLSLFLMVFIFIGERQRWPHNEAVEVGFCIEDLETSQCLILLRPLVHHLKLRPHREMPRFHMPVKRRKN